MIKYALLIIFLIWIDPNKIGKVNKAKAQAKEAFQRGEYKEAIQHYRTLVDSLGVNEDEVNMNLAHAYFQLNDTTNARNAYASLTNSQNAKFKSLANQQMGVMANRQGKFEEALGLFRNALKADPANEEARYNYEMVKKKLEEKKKQEEKQNKDKKKDDKNQKDKNNKDQKEKEDQKKDDQDKKDKEQKDKEQKEKDQKQQQDQQKKDQEQKNQKDQKEDPSVSEKLKEMKMSEEKARMVLEAMKNQEVQYLQQNKRKATKPKTKGKPDW
jgi:Ca-activated chloride channel family protein